MKPVPIERYFNFAHSDRADSEDFAPWGFKKVTKVYTLVTYFEIFGPPKAKILKIAVAIAICILYAGTKDAELLKFLSLSPESRQLSWIEQ